jgi:hypothetical protein
MHKGSNISETARGPVGSDRVSGLGSKGGAIFFLISSESGRFGSRVLGLGWNDCEEKLAGGLSLNVKKACIRVRVVAGGVSHDKNENNNF